MKWVGGFLAHTCTHDQRDAMRELGPPPPQRTRLALARPLAFCFPYLTSHYTLLSNSLLYPPMYPRPVL